ncbi:site-specific DNA-methyltransferase [Methyloceanibacter caenitepidi]|uniref:site-specific DNA-methyltransferase (adenine-specific) n=1 Tax=Methyloceanibacter caenitepidi TaxID=1384459 RepID=A0A0A8K0S8_9HYPH|nr:site-specific DNA-methyltransferase [Methyloceanibacter caenitepidi]BAQ15609.1 type III restriction-modification system methylation subunit [Methyloceanibacter caenitepidi]
MAGKYDDLTPAQLVELLEKRDRTKKLGLVWERDEIEADQAVDANFVTCRIVPDLSDKPAPWDNLVIEGDNFDALRWLRMTHAGRVKCIYIDPPYNTGNKDWVYNDRYMNRENRFRQSTWLEFLYRRLTLARDLLAEDGVLLISINDDQRAYLELMADEAMPGMRIGSFTWQTRAGTKGDGPYFSQDNEYVIAYGKPTFRFGGSLADQEKYSNPDNDPRGPWTSVALQTNKTRIERENSYFPVQNPRTKHWHPCNPNRVWPFLLRGMKGARGATFEDMFENDLILFSKEGESQKFETREELIEAIQSGLAHPYLKVDLPDLDFWIGKEIGLGTVRKKQFLSDLKEAKKPTSSFIRKLNEPDEDEDRIFVRSGMTGEGTREISRIFGHPAFNYAKPVSLIRELVRQSTGPDDLVLDFFAGSATTAQAVMELNAEDGGRRRFIMVSSTEASEDEPDKNICRDVSAERVRRLNASKDPRYADFAAAFAYLRTYEIAFEDLDYDLTPADAWVALEAMHDLPLTPYDPARPWTLHEGDHVALVLVDSFDNSLLDWLRGRDRQNLFVYAWAPGQIAQHLDGTDVDIRPVRDTLVKRFQN